MTERERESLFAFIETDSIAKEYGLTKEVLLDRLEHIKENGWGTAQGEWAAEASGVAAPVYNKDDEVIAAIAIAMPRNRYNKNYRDKCAAAAMKAAKLVGEEYDSINR